jgi:hypothetical protein
MAFQADEPAKKDKARQVPGLVLQTFFSGSCFVGIKSRERKAAKMLALQNQGFLKFLMDLPSNQG